MSVPRKRRHFSAAQKAEVVRRHLVGKVPVSDLADELGVQPGQIHQWVKQVLDHAEKAFERSGPQRRAEEADRRRAQQLEDKLAAKNEVIAELMEENVRTKKPMGDFERTLGSP